MEKEIEKIFEELNQIKKELKAAYVAVMILCGLIGFILVKIF